MARFLFNNLWNSAGVYQTLIATVSASASASGFPAENTQNTDRQVTWRAENAINPTLTLDLSPGYREGGRPNCIAVANMRGNPALMPVVRLQYSSNATAWTTLGTVPAESAGRRVSFLFFTPLGADYRYWRLLVDSGGSVLTSIDIGYVFLGTYLEPSRNTRMPVRRDELDPSLVVDTPSGHRTVSTQPRYQTGMWRFEGIPAADRTALLTMLRQIGVGVPIFAVLDPTDPSAAWLQYAGPTVEDSVIPRTTIYTVAWPWKEAPTR